MSLERFFFLNSLTVDFSSSEKNYFFLKLNTNYYNKLIKYLRLSFIEKEDLKLRLLKKSELCRLFACVPLIDYSSFDQNGVYFFLLDDFLTISLVVFELEKNSSYRVCFLKSNTQIISFSFFCSFFKNRIENFSVENYFLSVYFGFLKNIYFLKTQNMFLLIFYLNKKCLK